MNITVEWRRGWGRCEAWFHSDDVALRIWRHQDPLQAADGGGGARGNYAATPEGHSPNRVLFRTSGVGYIQYEGGESPKLTQSALGAHIRQRPTGTVRRMM